MKKRMKKYAVEIEATIRKTYVVEASDETIAAEIASGMFTPVYEIDVDEDYAEAVLSIKEVK